MNTVTEAYLNRHFFSQRLRVLKNFIDQYYLGPMPDLIIDQLQADPLPQLHQLVPHLYKACVEAIEEERVWETAATTEPVVLDLSQRLLQDYYLRSGMQANAFVARVRELLEKEARARNKDLHKLATDMDWTSMEQQLATLTPQGQHTNMQMAVVNAKQAGPQKTEVPRLLWNPAANLERLLKEVCVEQGAIADAQELRTLLEAECSPTHRVTVNAESLGYLAYLFRQLCPIRKPELSGGRIVETAPTRQLWPALARYLQKPGGTQWTKGAIKNACSAVKREAKHQTTRSHVDLLVQQLEHDLM